MIDKSRPRSQSTKATIPGDTAFESGGRDRQSGTTSFSSKGASLASKPVGDVRKHPQILKHAPAQMENAESPVNAADVRSWVVTLLQALAIFFAAAVIRTLVLFLITGPDDSAVGWFMDTLQYL